MAWFLLVLAGLLEVVWASALKASQGLTRPAPTVLFLAAATASLALLARAMRDLPAGTAYAAWTGIGAVGTVIVGVVLFGESREPARLAMVGLILAGVVGLRLVSPD